MKGWTNNQQRWCVTVGATTGDLSNEAKSLLNPHRPTHSLKRNRNANNTSILLVFQEKEQHKTENIKKHTPLNYTGSYKQNKVSFYIYISRGNDRWLLSKSRLKDRHFPLGIHLCAQDQQMTPHNPDHDCTSWSWGLKWMCSVTWICQLATGGLTPVLVT